MIKKGILTSILFILAVTCLIFFKIFTKGLYPVPGDLLVSFYFPYYSGDWEGYNPWTTHKELLGADSIRQIYLWKEFAAQEFKQGKAPLWNPYTFSGQPLLANFQSSVFYPFNIFYLLTDPRMAWILLIVIQPLLAGVFAYLAVRSFKIENVPSVFAAVAFMFSSYLITWMENGNISHSYIWLPLSFWAINNFFEKLKFRFLLILSLSLALSILAGHPQTAIYVYIAVAIFALYKLSENKKDFKFKSLALIFACVSSLLLSAIQLLPTYHFYKISPISLPFSTEVFDRAILPYKNLITFFASDFFGHPANNNFWSQTYGDFTPYFGVIPFIFSLWAIVRFWKRRFVKFTTLTSAFFILSAVHGPVTFIIKTFKIPLIDATTPSRFISISIFLMIILSALGFEDFLKNLQDKNYSKKFFYFLIPIGLVYVSMWLFAIIGTNFLEPKETWQINLAVTRRNLILPSLMYLTIPASVMAARISMTKMPITKNLLKGLTIAGFFIALMIGGIYYTNKFLPVAPKNFIFPDHLLFSWLKNNAQIDRFYGGGTAHIDFNFPTHYEVYGSEGYDTLRIERYAQLLAASFTGQVPKSYLRSDAVFPTEENGYRKRLFELLGVRYLLDKEDSPKTGADWHYERFPNDQIEGFWQYDKFQVYKRRNSLPRIFQTTKYLVAPDGEIIKKIYDPSFDLKTLLLEKEPSIPIKEMDSGIITIPKVVKYQPGEIEVDTNLEYNSLLFISDAHDPDWRVAVDKKEVPLLRAHYALLSAAIPAGIHKVTFAYKPVSFTAGLYVSIFAIITIALAGIYSLKKKKF